MSVDGFPMSWDQCTLLKGLICETSATPLSGAQWYSAAQEGAGLECIFPAGLLAGAKFLTADFLLDGTNTVVYELQLAEGSDGPVFGLWFSLLNQCQARMRFPLHLVDLHVRTYPREGSWKNIHCARQRVDLKKVDRLRLLVGRKPPEAVRWCMTKLEAVVEEPALLKEPLLPRGVLVDEIGQYTLRTWPGKSSGLKEVSTRLEQQLKDAQENQWPSVFSRWGGYKAMKEKATGFFHTWNDGSRWWLVDPEGHPFWSTGPDCAAMGGHASFEGIENAHAWLPDSKGEFSECFGNAGAFGGYKKLVSLMQANLIRTWGKEYRGRWEKVMISELKKIGFNTFGNWSSWKIASQHSFPYVRQLDAPFKKTPAVFRDMPDVFHPLFAEDCDEAAEDLRESAKDPALVGYFLMNEPQWGFVDEPLMRGILSNTLSCETRKEFARFLGKRYGNSAALANAWAMPGLTLEAIAEGPMTERIPMQAEEDLMEFSTVVVARFFDMLSAACRKVDPNHLNLGGRYYTSPPLWVQKGMNSFDVIGVNGYSDLVKRELGPFSKNTNKPIIIGEWHFGALDVGLPASGIGHVRTQADRGKAYRLYLEDAAALPWCVGAHWFTLYDEPPQGRFDGENYNIGFLDICHRPYDELCAAARKTHERLYEVALGKIAPYAELPERLPLLF